MNGELKFSKHIPPVLALYEVDEETEKEQVDDLIDVLKGFKYDKDEYVVNDKNEKKTKKHK